MVKTLFGLVLFLEYITIRGKFSSIKKEGNKSFGHIAGRLWDMSWGWNTRRVPFFGGGRVLLIFDIAYKLID